MDTPRGAERIGPVRVVWCDEFPARYFFLWTEPDYTLFMHRAWWARTSAADRTARLLAFAEGRCLPGGRVDGWGPIGGLSAVPADHLEVCAAVMRVLADRALAEEAP